MKTSLYFILAFSATLFLQSCMSDLRTKTVKKEHTEQNIVKGKQLLDEAWKAQGLDKLANHKVYEITGTDTWRGMMGKMGKLWYDNTSKLKLQYVVGTFDSKVNFLDGKAKNTSNGLQSWEYYTTDQQGNLNFPEKQNDRVVFGLAAFQYFTEMTDRLRKAPLITYAGQTTIDGTIYDQVFVTWEKYKAHKEHDQYIVLINTNTKMVDMVKYTIRENYMKMPGGLMMWGTMHFSDYRDVQGVKIPFKQTVFAFGPKKEKKNIHQLVIEKFEFDSFNEAELYPNTKVKALGDQKLEN